MNRYRSIELKDGYVVHFLWMQEPNWLHVSISFEGTLIAERKIYRSHTKAARWVRRKVREHKKAMRILKGAT